MDSLFELHKPLHIHNRTAYMSKKLLKLCIPTGPQTMNNKRYKTAIKKYKIIIKSYQNLNIIKNIDRVLQVSIQILTKNNNDCIIIQA